MSITIRIPTTLRPLTEGSTQVAADGATIGELIDDLDAKHPGFKEKILDDSGSIRKFVNIFLEDEDTKYLDGLDTSVTDNQTVSIVPAVAGGASL